jgi:hypothetical protein
VIVRRLVLPSPAAIHEQARRCGIDLGEPRFLLIERGPDLALPLTYQTVVEGMADWLLYIARVVLAEPDDALFPLLARLAYLTIRETYNEKLEPGTARTFSHELFDAFVILRTGDKYEARAAVVLAFTHATNAL